jgi:ATP-dependent Lon protease
LENLKELDLHPSEVNSIVDTIPEEMPILPLRDIVIFPYMIFPVLVGREQSIRAANFAADTNKIYFPYPLKKNQI